MTGDNETKETPWHVVGGLALVLLGLIVIKANSTYFSGADGILKYLPSFVPPIWWISKTIGIAIIIAYSWNKSAEGWKWVKSIGTGYLVALIVSYLVVLLIDSVPFYSWPAYFSTSGLQTGKAWWISVIIYFILWFMTTIMMLGANGLLESGPIEKERLIRGRELVSFEEAGKIAKAKVKAEENSIYFGWLRIPESQATTHFAIVGATGSGKTLIIKNLLQSILPHIALGTDKRALIYDAKRDMVPILKAIGTSAEVFILHPFDKRSVAWDMAKDITAPAVAEQTSYILIPQEKNAANPFFADAARALMTGVMTAFIRNCPEDWTLRDVILALKNLERLKEVLSSCEETKDLAAQYLSNEKLANDVLATVATKIQRYQYVAAAWDRAERRISLKEWLNSESILVLGNDEEARSAIDALNQVIFKRATELILNQTESATRRTWILLDEVKEAGELPGLSSILSKGRSKGACVVLGFQDIEGLSAVMKDTRLAHEIAGLCSHKAILRLDSAETAKWASQIFGEREVEEKRVSDSSGSSKQGDHSGRSESWVRVKKETVLPSQFLEMKPVEKTGTLSGYYIVPSVGSYRVNITMESILKDLQPTNSMLGYDPRDKEEQYLRQWDEEDLVRLKLHRKVAQTEAKATGEEKGLRGIFTVRRR